LATYFFNNWVEVNMRFSNLGQTGLKVSELCLGTMQFGWSVEEQDAHHIIDTAIEAGLNFIDTANVYSNWVEGNPGGVSETIIGNWLSDSGVNRDDLVIGTKVRGQMSSKPNDEGLSRKHIIRAAEDSLRRLQTDYIDLYQAHSFDDSTPIEETLSAFDDLIRQGKVRYIGCSNYPAWRLVQALWAADTAGLPRFWSLQPHYNLAHRKEFEQDLAEVCQTYGLGVIPYSPLAGGFLTGNYRRDQNMPESVRSGSVQKRYYKEEYFDLLDRMKVIALEKGDASISQIALAWLLADPLITSPIIGPRSLEQLQDNLGAAGLILNGEEQHLLDDASSI
jgi:aryl-alcohol dehydrogenase-like predicted oxidoreductase